jgi:hypothetical protein
VTGLWRGETPTGDSKNEACSGTLARVRKNGNTRQRSRKMQELLLRPPGQADIYVREDVPRPVHPPTPPLPPTTSRADKQTRRKRIKSRGAPGEAFLF